MTIAEHRIESINDLKAFIAETLCEHEELQLGAFPLTEWLLRRGGRICGIEFCLHGPRSVRLTAIWEIESQSVLFYNSAGERFHRAQLADTLSGLPADKEAA